jgi:hypothetical protein
MAWDAKKRCPGLLDRSTFAAGPVADSLKNVTSLLLFTAEKFAAFDDTLTKKKQFLPWARGFLDEVRKPGFRRF